MQQEFLEPHIWPCAELQVNTDRLSSPECSFHSRLEVPAHVACTVIPEKLENIGTNGLGVICCFCFDREEEVNDTAGDEGDEEAAVVENNILRRCQRLSGPMLFERKSDLHWNRQYRKYSSDS